MGAVQLFAAVVSFIAAASYNALALDRQPDLPVGPAAFYVIGSLSLVFGGLLVWGGLAAYHGKTSKILFFVACGAAVLGVAGLFLGSVRSGVISIAAGGGIIYLLLRPESKQWFLAKGGTTI